MNLYSIKRSVKLAIRAYKDWFGRIIFAKKTDNSLDFSFFYQIKQEIKASAFFEEKLYNITRAAGKIHNTIVQPNEVFSFWKLVGNPDIDFKKSRSIRNGKIFYETGGGLCQAAGILHQVCLHIGLKIKERYAHSIDLYLREEDRFAPLGTDATVVFGWKDFRFINSKNHPIQILLFVKDNQLVVQLRSDVALSPLVLKQEIIYQEQKKEVIWYDEKNQIINQSVYQFLAKGE
jgi:vancomycin resistance protein VanW